MSIPLSVRHHPVVPYPTYCIAQIRDKQAGHALQQLLAMTVYAMVCAAPGIYHEHNINDVLLFILFILSSLRVIIHFVIIQPLF